jgi:hypothetical protein
LSSPYDVRNVLSETRPEQKDTSDGNLYGKTLKFLGGEHVVDLVIQRQD